MALALQSSLNAAGVASVAPIVVPADIVDAVVTTDVEAAVAVLEADGATPTQAHVNSLRTVWDALVTALTANQSQMTDSVVIAIDPSAIDNVGELRRVFNAAEVAAVASGQVTK